MTTSTSDKQLSFYNPVTAVYLSFFLTPVLGTYFHLKNWSSLGEQKKASRGKAWLFGSSVFLIIYLMLWNGADHATAFWTHIGYCVIWYLFYAKDQIKYFEGNFKEGYAKKSQVIKALVCVIPLFALLGAAANIVVNATDGVASSNVHFAADENGILDKNKVCGGFADEVINLLDENADNLRAGVNILMIKNVRLAYKSDAEQVYICHAQFVDNKTDVAPLYYAKFRGGNNQDYILVQQNLRSLISSIKEMNPKSSITEENPKVFEAFFRSFAENRTWKEFSREQEQEMKYFLGETSANEFFFGVP
ncbi:MAG: hypothetical protein H3C49_03115 [Alphaproteobacteria bacterium]|nr:hypothetical protein [Alphaproteobacteria bacterium]